jgi:spermidine/putrescine-binding protein
MKTRKGPAILGALATALALMLGAASAQAESACKGLVKGKCENSASCTWVDSFTHKDGVKVAAYCRAKPSSSGKKASSTDKKS